MGGTYFTAWNVVHVDIGSKNLGGKALYVNKDFPDKKSGG